MKRERIPVRLFIIAAAADAAHQTELEKHLVPLWQQGLLANWQSRQPGEGAEDAFSAARLIVLLLSVDGNVDASYQEQMQRALERQREGKVQVLPILLRPVEMTNAPFAHLAMVPTNRQAVTMWENQDAVWAHITEAIRCLVEGKSLPQVEEQKQEMRFSPQRKRPFSLLLTVSVVLLVVIGGLWYNQAKHDVITPTDCDDLLMQSQQLSVFSYLYLTDELSQIHQRLQSCTLPTGIWDSTANGYQGVFFVQLDYQGILRGTFQSRKIEDGHWDSKNKQIIFSRSAPDGTEVQTFRGNLIHSMAGYLLQGTFTDTVFTANSSYIWSATTSRDPNSVLALQKGNK